MMRPLFRLCTLITLAACCLSLSPIAAQTTRQVVTAENANQLTQVGQLGMGIANILRWSGDTIAVGSTTGVALYDSLHLDAAPRTLKEQTGAATTLAFSADGKTIAVSSSDKSLRIWNVQSAEPAITLKSEASVTTIAFSPDGSTLATGDQDNKVRLWDVKTGEPGRVLASNLPVQDMAFSLDGNSLVAADQSTVMHLWAVKTGQERALLRGHQGAITAVAFSPDGKLIASGSQDRTIRLWDATSGTQLAKLAGNMEGVVSMVFSPSGRTLAAGAVDGRIWLWNVEGQTERRVLRQTSVIKSLAYSPDGATLAACDGNSTITLWNPVNGAAQAEIKGGFARYRRLIFADNNRTLAAITDTGVSQSWNIDDKKIASDFTQLAAADYLFYSPDRSTFVSGGPRSGKIEAHVYDAATNHERALLQYDTKYAFFNLAFSNDSKQIATTDGSPTVHLWDAKTGEARGTLSIAPKDELLDTFYTPLFSLDDKTLYVIGNKHDKDNLKQTSFLYEWSLASGEAKAPVQLPALASNHADFRSANTLLLSTVDKKIQAFNLETHDLQSLLTVQEGNRNNFEVSPDRKSLVIFAYESGKSFVILFDAATGKELRRFAVNNGGISTYYIFSPNGQLFAFSETKFVHVWDTRLGVEKALLGGHTAQVYDVDFAPDGTILASASDDGTIRLWGVK